MLVEQFVRVGAAVDEAHLVEAVELDRRHDLHELDAAVAEVLVLQVQVLRKPLLPLEAPL